MARFNRTEFSLSTGLCVSFTFSHDRPVARRMDFWTLTAATAVAARLEKTSNRKEKDRQNKITWEITSHISRIRCRVKRGSDSWKMSRKKILDERKWVILFPFEIVRTNLWKSWPLKIKISNLKKKQSIRIDHRIWSIFKKNHFFLPFQLTGYRVWSIDAHFVRYPPLPEKLVCHAQCVARTSRIWYDKRIVPFSFRVTLYLLFYLDEEDRSTRNKMRRKGGGRKYWKSTK